MFFDCRHRCSSIDMQTFQTLGKELRAASSLQRSGRSSMNPGEVTQIGTLLAGRELAKNSFQSTLRRVLP